MLQSMTAYTILVIALVLEVSYSCFLESHVIEIMLFKGFRAVEIQCNSLNSSGTCHSFSASLNLQGHV